MNLHFLIINEPICVAFIYLSYVNALVDLSLSLLKFCLMHSSFFFFSPFYFSFIGDIVNYLFQQYGKGRSPSTGLLERCSTFVCKISYSVGVYIPSMNSGITISMKVYWPGIRSSCNIILEADTKFVARFAN